MTKRSDRERKDVWERATLAMVGSDLQVEVEHWDVDGRQGAPDGRFFRTDRVGFVEVTTLADTNELSGQAVYSERFAAWQPGGLTWSFTVNVAPNVPVDEFERHVADLARAMELRNVSDPLQVPDLAFIVTPATAEWCEELMESGRLRMHGSRETSRPGTIYAVPAMGSGGMVPDDPDVLLPAIAQTMNHETILRRLAKLDETGESEQHLVITVLDGMWNWAPTHVLTTRSDGVPGAPPDVPDHLDGLWLFATMNRSVLRWLRTAGWAWVPFPALDDDDRPNAANRL